MLASLLRHETCTTKLTLLLPLSHIRFQIKKPFSLSFSDSNPQLQNHPNPLNLLESCRNPEELQKIHARIIVSGQTQDQLLINILARLCTITNIKNFDYLIQVFDRVNEPDIFIWNTVIRALSSSINAPLAIYLYNRMMVCKKIVPDNYTFPFVFRACANLSATEKGREIHGLIIKMGFESDRFVQSSLLNMYAVCGEIDNARRVFDEFTNRDIVFWNTMISGYAQSGRILEGLKLLYEMQLGGVGLNEATILSLIVACTKFKYVELGRKIHDYAKYELGFFSGIKLGTALIDFYSKCGCLDCARQVFDEMPERVTVTWNSLISGYTRSGFPRHAIELFQQMQVLNAPPDKFTISAVLSACAQMGALSLGEWIHRFVNKNKIWDVFVGTGLIDMYAKCGSISAAREVFDKMPERNLTSWNAILSCYALHGHALCALNLFSEMQNSGTRPDPITFVAVLNACAHVGLVEDGYRYMQLMVDHYKIIPKVEHYGCMVDLLGRAGLLKEAEELIRRMDVRPNVVVWGALLSACSIHGNVEIGERAANHVFGMDQMDGGSYILLSNVYAACGRFDRVKEVREMMAVRGVRKPPGCSMIEIGDVVHEFVVADKAHPRSEEIYMLLDELSTKLKIAGYVPMLILDQEK